MKAEELEAFFADPTVSRLRSVARETNALGIAYPRELQISNFLAWLLSPGEGHGLNDLGLQALLKAAWQSAEAGDRAAMANFSPSRLGLMSLGAALCIREYGVQNAGRCDLVIVDPVSKLIVTLENKYGAKQGAVQPENYRKGMRRRMRGKAGWTQLYIFMDSDSTTTPKSEGWLKVDYQWAVDLIDEQLALKHVSAESLQTLQMYRPYLADDAEAPFVALEDSDEQVLHIAAEHEAVLRQMSSFRTWSWQETVSKMTSPRLSPLLVEYQQRWKLWDYVLDASSWISFTKPYRDLVEDVIFDAKAKSLYISRDAWLKDWQTSETEYLPAWVKVYRTGRDGNAFAVEAVIYLARITEEARPAVFERAKKVRDENGLRAASIGVNRFVLKAAPGTNRASALKSALSMRLLLDEVLLGPVHQHLTP